MVTQRNLQSQRGAALLAAMLTVTLVATIASAAMWQQYRNIEIETAERSRAQSAWVLTGALDWARLILREDARSSAMDDLSEPWSVPLAEARLSTFLAAADQNASTDTGDAASEVFLSGRISDMQSKLNVLNLVDGGKVSEHGFRSFRRLFELLNLPTSELNTLAEGLRMALDTIPNNPNAALAPLLPQRMAELTWLGVSPFTIARIEPYVAVLPMRAVVNLNTAPVEVVFAAVPGIDMAMAQRLVTQRGQVPFRTLADAGKFTPGVELVATEHGIGTRYFEVRGRLRSPRGMVEERSLIQRDGLDVKVLRRERVPPELPTGKPSDGKAPPTY